MNFCFNNLYLCIIFFLLLKIDKHKQKDFGVASFSLLNLRTHFLVSCSLDNTIKMWDLETRECIRTLEGHSAEIHCIDVLENGFLISGSKDKSLKIWNPSDGACLKTI